MAKRRHIPERTCAACGKKLPKAALVRIVKTPHGTLQIDLSGKTPGRGAYLCRDGVCWRKGAQKGSLERSLRANLTAEDRNRLYSSFQEFTAQELTAGTPSEV